MHLIKALEEEFHGHKKAIEDNPETEHERILILRRIEKLRSDLEKRFPDNEHRTKAIATLSDFRKHCEDCLDAQL